MSSSKGVTEKTGIPENILAALRYLKYGVKTQRVSTPVMCDTAWILLKPYCSLRMKEKMTSLQECKDDMVSDLYYLKKLSIMRRIIRSDSDDEDSESSSPESETDDSATNK